MTNRTRNTDWTHYPWIQNENYTGISHHSTYQNQNDLVCHVCGNMENLNISLGSTYQNQNHLDCYVCGIKKPGCQMSQLRFWNHSYCKIHKSDGTPRCYSCRRYKKTGSVYINLTFDRKLCRHCHSVAIMDDKKCELVIHNVHRFFKTLNLEVEKDIPILLVDRDEMNKLANKIGPAWNTSIGLTTYSVATVNKVTRCSQRGEDIVVVQKPQKLMKRKVTSILLLYGMSCVMTGVTLAHEIMHTWFAYQGYTNLKEDFLEEGMCQVISHKWLEWLASTEGDYSLCKASTSELARFVSHLREYERTSIESRCDIYGDEFRKAKSAVDKFGLETTLNHIGKKGSLPK